MDLDSLNGPQRAAVTAADGPHLVIAGAGTGKTRTLVHRVAYLLTQRPDVAPWEIVLLTFTRRAAAEMLERATALVGPRAQRVKGGTFHSFAASTLRRHAQVLGYSRSFTILDSADADAVMGLVRGELGLGGRGAGKRFPAKKAMLKVVSSAINTSRPIVQVIEEDFEQYADFVADIERAAVRYAERKKQQDVMDFDDLLVRLLELLRDHPEASREVASRCKHVLVDEYQDTNRLQAEIAARLAAVHNSLMVVGDEAQSIYGFRGAYVRNILDFPKLFPACQTTMLEENYRSTMPVLELANGVLDSFTTGFDKELWSDLEGEELPRHLEVADEEAEANWLVAEILANRESGVALEDQAVLFRSAFHANLLETLLSAADIPYRKFGGLKFLEAAHVKDVLALLRIVGNPRDALAWFRVLQWFEGIGTKTAQRIADGASASGISQLDPSPFAKRKYYGGLVTLAGWLQAAAETEDLVELVTTVVRAYGEKGPDLYDDWRRRAPDLDTLPVLATRYEDLTTFLEEVALDPPASAEPDDPQEEQDEAPLTLSTVHSAKGLEWHTVYVMRLGDGHFPSGYALDSAESMEEERRLFYVAVTRAKRTLILMEPRFLAARWGNVAGPGCTLLDDIEGYTDLVQVERGDGSSPWAREDDEAALADRLQRFKNFFGG